MVMAALLQSGLRMQQPENELNSPYQTKAELATSRKCILVDRQMKLQTPCNAARTTDMCNYTHQNSAIILASDRTCNSSLAKFMAMTPAEQPIPARLYDTILERILKWLIIIADSEGVGLNRLQLTTRMSICKAREPNVMPTTPT